VQELKDGAVSGQIAIQVSYQSCGVCEGKKWVLTACVQPLELKKSNVLRVLILASSCFD
jgi:hypothetical protein